MSYFAEGTLEEEILADVQYLQSEKNVTDLEVVHALVQVVNYLVKVAKDDERKS